MAQKKNNTTPSIESESEDTALRISTLVEQNGVNSLVAAAVMAEHGLKPSDRITASRFLQMVTDWQDSPTGRR